ncbi:synembryn-A [Trichonephila inaurata madagascariensis]|uniref:Synembryn-A n=1 Tax=Trichonephila inaurata madagascariensis TaxID=2747483 RepID=A0A8X6XAS1_9ARAC|nr:synembryn-A [Trichonephila inaurata madagascariensis]
MAQSPATRVGSLETVRILSRDKIDLEGLFTRETLGHLVNMAGLVAEEEEIMNQCSRVSDPKVIVEAQKCLCNLVYNSSFAQKTCCYNGCIEGILLRLRTYKDPKIPHEVKTAPWENWHLERGFKLLRTFGLVRWGLGGSSHVEGTGEKLSFVSQAAR